MGFSTITTVDGEGKFRSLFDKYMDSNNLDIHDFILSIPSSLDDSITVLNKTPDSFNEYSLENRRNLISVINDFHNKAGTLTESTRKRINLLNNKDAKIIVAIHQPNLFAFGGVFKKIVLLETLAQKLEKSNTLVIPLFLIIDHDFMDDKWMHTAKLPNMRSANGILDLRYPINEYKRWKISCKTEPPTQSILNSWENQIYKWIKNDKNLSKDEIRSYTKNFEKLWDLVVESLTTSNNYAEFNSFIISKLTNNVWNYETLFTNLSNLSRVFKGGYNFLLSNSNIYSDSLEKSESFFREHGISTGVSAKSNKNSPLWLHCICGSKGSSVVKKNEKEEIFLVGKCISCKKQLSLRIGSFQNISIPEDHLDKISPRAIPILLLLARELKISGYISGTGGSLGYTIVGKKVFDDLGIKLPSMIVWPAVDKYSGFAQKEAINYLKDKNITDLDRIFKEIEGKNDKYKNLIKPLVSKRQKIYKDPNELNNLLKELFYYKQEQRNLKDLQKNILKVKNTLNLKPCLIDYIVNFGIIEVGNKWKDSLIKNNDFTKPLILD